MGIQARFNNMVSNNTIIGKFKKLWFYYILQSFLAALALFILVLFLGKEKMVVISSIGASGAIFFYFTDLPYFVEYPCAVGLAIFLMVVLDVEHPPAAGTALAVVINEVSPAVFVAIMTSALILSQCRYFLRHHLKDLV